MAPVVSITEELDTHALSSKALDRLLELQHYIEEGLHQLVESTNMAGDALPLPDFILFFGMQNIACITS